MLMAMVMMIMAMIVMTDDDDTIPLIIIIIIIIIIITVIMFYVHDPQNYENKDYKIILTTSGIIKALNEQNDLNSSYSKPKTVSHAPYCI
jgi:archaellum biogenesis protein FlaJ (TadC family)